MYLAHKTDRNGLCPWCLTQISSTYSTVVLCGVTFPYSAHSKEGTVGFSQAADFCKKSIPIGLCIDSVIESALIASSPKLCIECYCRVCS